MKQLIPSDIKFDANATPPQYTDNGDQVIEKGTHIRIKLIGTRSDVGSMYAIGSIKEVCTSVALLDAMTDMFHRGKDYLGYILSYIPSLQ